MTPDTDRPDLTVIIVNWNTRELLRQCLESLYDKSVSMRFEVIVVDNGSTDESVLMVQSAFPQVRLIRNTENRGFAAANNQGIREARGEFILLLNSDIIVLENALDNIVDFARNHPQAGAVGGKLFNADMSSQVSCGHFPSLINMATESLGLSRLFPRNHLFARFKMTYWDHNDVREVDQPMGAFLLLRCQALDEVGIFDERFFMYFEEVDLCFRLNKAAWRIYFTPEARVIHLGGQSSRQNLNARIVERYKSLVYFFAKHYSLVESFLLKGLIVFEMTWRLLFTSIGSIFSKRRSTFGVVSKRYLEVVGFCVGNYVRQR